MLLQSFVSFWSLCISARLSKLTGWVAVCFPSGPPFNALLLLGDKMFLWQVPHGVQCVALTLSPALHHHTHCISFQITTFLRVAVCCPPCKNSAPYHFSFFMSTFMTRTHNHSSAWRIRFDAYSYPQWNTLVLHFLNTVRTKVMGDKNGKLRGKCSNFQWKRWCFFCFKEVFLGGRQKVNSKYQKMVKMYF